MAMIGKIRRLYFRDKVSVSEIARRTGLSRNTIKKWLRATKAAEPRYRRREKPGKLAGFEVELVRALEDKGLLVKAPDEQQGKRIHLRLTRAGRAVLNDSWTQRIERELTSPPSNGASLEASLRGVLLTLQRLNGQRPFRVCRQCAHFLREARCARCGLTGEPLATEQILKICREWTPPARDAA